MASSKRAREGVCLSEAEILQTLQLSAGHTVAEIGPSRFTAALKQAVGREGHVVAAPHPHLPDHSCDRVLIAGSWRLLADPIAALEEAARLLRHDGRLLVVEDDVDFKEMLLVLEHNCFDVHRHGEAGAQCWFIEAAVSDQSVQS